MKVSLDIAKAALGDVIARGESEPASVPVGSGYDILCGGTRFTSYAAFPQWEGIATADGRKSHAAGRYQFEPATWETVAKDASLGDFTPAAQDAGMWWLAAHEYQRHTGRDLGADLGAGRVVDVVPALHSTWPSLEEQSFAALWQAALSRRQALAPKPAPAPSPVHGGIATGGTVGFAFALVDLLATLLTALGHPLPGNAQADLVTLLTAIGGFAVHSAMMRTRS